MELKALLKYEEPDFSVPNCNDFIFFVFKSLSRNKTCQNICLRDMFSISQSVSNPIPSMYGIFIYISNGNL